MFSWVLASGMFLEVVEGLEEACVSLYGILFDSTWTEVLLKSLSELLENK